MTTLNAGARDAGRALGDAVHARHRRHRLRAARAPRRARTRLGRRCARRRAPRCPSSTACPRWCATGSSPAAPSGTTRSSRSSSTGARRPTTSSCCSPTRRPRAACCSRSTPTPPTPSSPALEAAGTLAAARIGHLIARSARNDHRRLSRRPRSARDRPSSIPKGHRIGRYRRTPSGRSPIGEVRTCGSD